MSTTPVERSPTGGRRFERNRKEILKAAERVFRRYGHEGFTMGRIAKLVDYAPSALYNYFRSKADILECVREGFFERLLSQLDQVMADPWTVEGARACLITYMTTALEEPNHYRMAFMSGDVPPPGEGSNAWLAAEKLKGMIGEGIAQGHFAEADTGVTAKCVWAALHGLTLLLADNDPADDSDACDAADVLQGPFATGGPIERSTVIAQHADLILGGLQRGTAA